MCRGGTTSSSLIDSYWTAMSHSPVPRIWTLHFFNHSIKVTLSRASHSQTIRPDNVSHKTRILITSAFSSSLKCFSNRETSWRVMQAIAWVETNFGNFNFPCEFLILPCGRTTDASTLTDVPHIRSPLHYELQIL